MGKFPFYLIVSVSLLQLSMAVGVFADENLPDPTRPPSSLGPFFGDESDKAPIAMPVLQSIILSATRKAAMISGQTVMLGEKFGDARLVKLTPSEAVLRTGEEFQVLKLFPDVEKKERLVPQDGIMSKSDKKKSVAVLGKKAK